MKYLVEFLLIGLIVMLAGCGAAPLHVKINSASQLNPDEQNHSLPVQVVIYQLRDPQVFEQATFEELWQNDAALLGSSMMSRQVIDIAPHTQNKITIDREKEAAYIGVIAIFRNPENGHWRAIKKIGKKVPLVRQTITVNIKQYRVSLS